MGVELLTAAGTGSRLTRPRPAAEVAARRTLRSQIASLEAELAEAFVTAFEMRLDGVHKDPVPGGRVPHLLDLGELEQVRDELAGRLREMRLRVGAGAERQARKRELLARMRLEPGRHRFTRVSCRELGEPGCGVWQVRPRLGPVGMLMGWWQVTLSSGCPLAGGRRRRATPSRPGPHRPRGGARPDRCGER
jgi:hypothetical protein